MPDNTDVERVIYKMEIDGSAYVEGVDKTAAATNKLSDAQEAANKKLAELKTQQAAYKKDLDSVNAVLKANEKETLDLTKKLNDLKAAEKGTSTEAKNLQTQLRGITTNTKEFKIEAATLKNNLTATTAAIKTQTAELKAAATATGGFSAGVGKAYSGLRTLANIIPGLGIGSLVALIAGPLVNAFSKWASSIDDVNQQQNLLNDAFKTSEYQNAIKDVSALTLNIKLAKDGFLDKKEVLKEYNDTLGKSLGAVKNLDEAEDNLVKKGPAYIQMTLLKAAANLALDKAAQQAVEAALDLQKSQDKVAKVAAKGQSQADVAAGTAGLSKFIASGIQNEAIAAKQEADKGIEKLKSIAESFQKDAAEIAKKFSIDFDPDNQPKAVKAKVAKQIEDDFEKRKADLIAKISALAAAEGETELKIRQQYADKLAKAELEINQDKTITAAERRKLIVLAEKLNYLELEKALIEYNRDKAKIISDAFIKEFDERDQQDKLLLKQQLEAGAERIKAIEDAEKAKYAAMKTPVPFQGATKDENDEKKDELAQYADAVGAVADSVIQFWASINEAEAKALDYSISLQEKRVDAAQRLADRGNAQYLKQEEDKLNELNVQRENAARKQLGIDAALQASQILVGITGAISHIGTGTGAQTIAEIAVIIASLASGYALVKSLQGNQPSLFVGTKDTGTGGNEDNKKGFTATLHPHEAVIPEDRNKEYHPAVSAIYDRTIPAEELNRFVTTYHKIKPVPQLAHDRIKEAAMIHVERDGKMSVLLLENNKKLDRHIELQETTIRYLKNMGVKVNLDQNGFAVTQMEVIEKMKRDKRI